NTEGQKCPNKECNRVNPNYIHPRIVKDEEDHFSFYIEYPEIGGAPKTGHVRRGLKKSKENKIRLYPDTIKAILERIPDDVVKELGRGEAGHPRKLVLRGINIPPVSIRPGVKNYGNGSSSYHDSSTLLQSIVKSNSKLPDQLPETMGSNGPGTEPAIIDQNYLSIQNQQLYYYSLIMGSTPSDVTKGNTGRRGLVIGSRPLNGFLRNLPRKDGHIRMNLLGKRVFYISRSTISGNMKLRIDEIGIPISFARTLQVEETVQEYNRDWLMPFFLNGRKQYPGSTRIKKHSTGEVHDVAGLRDFRLEIGDILFRDVVNGDLAFFN
ncbi:33992_t:CDS:1, partial [Racocetra persica]